MRRATLGRAVRASGSVVAFARRIGVHPSTVRRWVKRGVPKASKKIPVIERVAESLERGKKTRKGERQIFAELLKLAGSNEKFPKVRAGQGERAGRLTQGWQTTRRIERELDLEGEVVDEIAAWASGVPKRFPIFQIVATASLYALSDDVDLSRRDKTGHRYPTVQVKLAHDEAENFVIDAKITSVAGSTRAEVVGDFEERLWAEMQNGQVRVFVHAVTVFNYRRRSKEEIRGHERGRKSKGRRKRKKRRTSRSTKNHSGLAGKSHRRSLP